MEEGNSMLDKPSYGWTSFQPDDNWGMGLSYLDDIAFYWLDAAIGGLLRNEPFTVEGHSEPGYMTCKVTDHYCSIRYECFPYSNHAIINMTKGQFCQNLYEDISRDIDAWTAFCPQQLCDGHRAKRRRALRQRLRRLKKLLLNASGNSDTILSAT